MPKSTRIIAGMMRIVIRVPIRAFVFSGDFRAQSFSPNEAHWCYQVYQDRKGSLKGEKNPRIDLFYTCVRHYDPVQNVSGEHYDYTHHVIPGLIEPFAWDVER